MERTLVEIQHEVAEQMEQSDYFDLDDTMTTLMHAAVGLMEESGEVAGLLKRYGFKNGPYVRERWMDELGDVMWYLAACAEANDLSLDQIWEYNLAKLEARYGITRQR